MWMFSLELVALWIHLFVCLAESIPFDGSATKDATDTRPQSETNNKLDIYFIDRNNDNSGQDIESYRTEIPSSSFDEGVQSKSNDISETKIHDFLLTATDSKQNDRRHELYTNPKTPEIQFRTESPFLLKTVASPFLVQNSVRSKPRLKRKASRHKRRAPQNPQPSGSRLIPQYEIKEPTWFKKYESLYSNAMKASAYPLRSQISSNNQRAAVSQQWQQNQGPALRSQIPPGDYKYGYVYPLYQLHTSDAVANTRSLHTGETAIIPSYVSQHIGALNTREAATVPRYEPQNTRSLHIENPRVIPSYAPQNTRVESRNQIGQNQVPFQNRKLQSQSLGYYPVPQKVAQQQVVKNTIPYAIYKQASFPNVYAVRSNTASQVYTGQLPPKAFNYQSRLPDSDTTLQRIGLKDDASFIDASPNFDRSAWTLNAIQSIIPKLQGRSEIPRYKKLPDTVQKDKIPNINTISSIQSKSLNSLVSSLLKASMNSNQQAPQLKASISSKANSATPQVKADTISQNTVPQSNVVKTQDTKPQNILPEGKIVNLIKTPRVDKSQTSNLILQKGSQTNNFVLQNNNADVKKPIPLNEHDNNISVPLLNTQGTNKTVNSNSARPLSAAQSESSKRDVIFKEVGQTPDIDSDAVTAENLATIFSELDNSNKITSDVAKKDEISMPSKDAQQHQSDAETNPTKNLVKEQSIGKNNKVSFVDVPIEKESEINFEQKLGKSSTKIVKALPMVKQNIQRQNIQRQDIGRQKFDLKRLHFGMANGNSFE